MACRHGLPCRALVVWQWLPSDQGGRGLRQPAAADRADCPAAAEFAAAQRPVLPEAEDQQQRVVTGLDVQLCGVSVDSDPWRGSRPGLQVAGIAADRGGELVTIAGGCPDRRWSGSDPGRAARTPAWLSWRGHFPGPTEAAAAERWPGLAGRQGCRASAGCSPACLAGHGVPQGAGQRVARWQGLLAAGECVAQQRGGVGEPNVRRQLPRPASSLLIAGKQRGCTA
jgi:hypothetical protein